MKLSIKKHQAGIDLGTTNSEIAVYDEKGLRCLPIYDQTHKRDQILLPSAVFFKRDMSVITGQEALNEIRIESSLNGSIGFKRKMGQDEGIPIDNLDKTLLPDELSGLVLKRLKEIYGREFGEELITAVVTVPMRFKENACHATKIAASGSNQFLLNPDEHVKRIWKTNPDPKITAKLEPYKTSNYYCDFLSVNILMEPIAAATAYGILNQSEKNSNWLVYDLGGGTFDVAVVNYFNKIPRIIASDGDEHLGGNDLDYALMSHIIDEINKNKKFSIDKEHFKHSSDRSMERTLLLLELEKKKIELSNKVNKKQEELEQQNLSEVQKQKQINEVFVEINLPEPSIRDDNNKMVSVSIKLTAEDYNSIIGPHISKTLDICLKMLSKSNIEIDKVILVGGPTKYFYIKKAIETRLGVKVDNTIDPMTAIAQGAAIYASIQEIEDADVVDEIKRIIGKGERNCKFDILEYPNSTNSLNELITGKIETKKTEHIRSISFKRVKDQFVSEEIEIEPDGTFVADLDLLPNCLNEFEVILNTHGGAATYKALPEAIQMRHPAVVPPKDIAPYNLNVTLFDGTCHAVIKKDQLLPAKQSHDFWTVEPIKKTNQKADLLKIEISEGQSIFANRNLIISELVFTNEDIKTNLPNNTKVPVTIEQKGDRSIIATAEVDGKTLQGHIKSMKTVYTEDSINEFYVSAKQEKDRIMADVKRWAHGDTNELLEKHEAAERLKQIENIIDGKTNDSDPLPKARNQTADLFVSLEEIESEFIIIRIQKRIDVLNKIKTNGGVIENDLENWNKNFVNIKERYNAASNDEEKNNAYKEAKLLEEQLLEYDRHELFARLVYQLLLFTSTREAVLIQGFADLINAIIKAGEEYQDYYLLSGIEPVIGMWNRDMNNTNYKYFKKYINKIKEIIPDDAHREFMSYISQDSYNLSDYETVAKHFNKLFNNNDEIFNYTHCSKMAKFDARGSVLQGFVKCARLLLENKIEEFLIKKDQFIATYYVSEEVAPKFGDNTSSIIIKSL